MLGGGDKDYGAILILRDELVKFLMANKYKKYFSLQTQKQIDIGLFITELTQKETESQSSLKVLIDLLWNKLLKRDEGWKAYYNREMNSLQPENTHKILTELTM